MSKEALRPPCIGNPVRNVFIGYDYAAEIFLGETILIKLFKKMFGQQAKTLLRAIKALTL